MKLWPGWLVVLAGACGGSSRDVSGTTTPNLNPALGAPNATVIRVVDGDTFDADFDGTEERIRMIGIDTPETKKPDAPVECFGPEATSHAETLLPAGTPIRVVRDVEARDDYGRLLAYVYRGSDGEFVNLALVANGFARPLTIPPNVAFAPEFVEAARAAEATGNGLWGACTG
jgi:micrococcal nuclease